MAVDVSKIPNSKNFDTVREAIIALDDSISDTGNSINNTQITIAAGTNMTGGGVFTLNQSNTQTITLDANDQTMTDAEVKTAYENNADTNAFTDAEKTKLGTVATNADVTSTAITSISVTAHNDVTSAGSGQIITATERTKLNGIEDNATADQTASEILTLVKSVDGATSGLDADLLDGEEGSYYLDYANFYGNYTTDFDSSGNRQVRGLLYYVGTESSISNVNNPSGTFDFTTNQLNLTGTYASDWSEFPPDSTSSGGTAVFTLSWSSNNTGGGTESTRSVTFGVAQETSRFVGPVTFSALGTADATVIDGSNITTGSIQSAGFDAGATNTDFSDSGTKIFLSGTTDNSAGDIISPQFKIVDGSANFKGSVTSTSGSIGGWDLSEEGIISPNDRIELLSNTGIIINDSSGTPKLQIRDGDLSSTAAKTISFSGTSNIEFSLPNETVSTSGITQVYKTTGTTYLTSNTSVGSNDFGIYTSAIQMNAAGAGSVALTTSSDFNGTASLSVKMEVATDVSFNNVLNTYTLQSASANTSSSSVSFAQQNTTTVLNLSSTATALYIRVYFEKNVLVTSGSVTFSPNVGILCDFDINASSISFGKSTEKTEITDGGLQVVYDANHYFRTAIANFNTLSNFVTIEGGLTLNGLSLDVELSENTTTTSSTASGKHMFKVNDDFIIQWGFITASSNPVTNQTFYQAFPNRCRSIQICTFRSSSGGSGFNYAYNVTKSNFSAVVDSPFDFWYIAIGD